MSNQLERIITETYIDCCKEKEFDVKKFVRITFSWHIRERRKWALGLLPSKEEADPKQLDYAWQRGRNCVIDYICKKIAEKNENRTPKETTDKINVSLL